MTLPSPTEQLLASIGYLRRGINRWKVLPCLGCGKRNRVDVWRLLMMKVGARANCGECKANLMRAVRG